MSIENAPGFAPKSAAGTGFTPNTENKAKRQQAETIAPPAAPNIPDEQKGIVQASTQDAGIQRLQDSQAASGAMVQSLMNAAQQQAMMQAQAIAAYPALVDNLTVSYLEQMGVSLGESSSGFNAPAWECPAMDSFRAVLAGAPIPKQLAAAE